MSIFVGVTTTCTSIIATLHVSPSSTALSGSLAHHVFANDVQCVYVF